MPEISDEFNTITDQSNLNHKKVIGVIRIQTGKRLNFDEPKDAETSDMTGLGKQVTRPVSSKKTPFGGLKKKAGEYM